MTKQVPVDCVDIRPFSKDDINFIYATWIRGLYFGNSWFREIPDKIYYAKYHKVIDRIIESPDTHIQIACLKEDPGVIIGYAVMIGEPKDATVLHWVFTREVWRKLGVARKLIPPQIEVVTHLTKIGKNLKPKEWVFDPFLA